MDMLKYAIIQHNQNADVPLNDPGRYGVLVPINFDGFYRDNDTAKGVAKFMAQQRPDLETLLVEVVERVSP